METKILQDIAVIFTLAIGVLYLLHRLRLPLVVGFLLTGIVAGPHGLGLIQAVDQVDSLAQVGVIILLFTIGIEFSLADLIRQKKAVFIGGSVQVLGTIALTFLLAWVGLGNTPAESVFMGFLIAQSSTAIMMKYFQERAQADSPQAHTALAVSIFQDVGSVPLMLLTPFLAGVGGKATGMGVDLLLLLVKAAAMIVVVLVLTKYAVPRLLFHIARTRNREIFLLAILVICLGVVGLTNRMGLSIALGAFLAGLIISESEYSHQALGNILPLRDIFTSFFFVSIGMLLNIHWLFDNPLKVGGIVLLVLLLKIGVAGGAALLLGLPLRTCVLVGFALSNVGEFSFILSQVGRQYDILNNDIYQYFIAVSVLTMAATPVMLSLGPRIADWLMRLPLPARLKADGPPRIPINPELRDHTIIIGYGLNGQNLARAARAARIPYYVIETNPDTVRKFQALGEPIYFGDAIHPSVLENARINSARILVVAVNDPVGVRRITESARRLNPGIYIIVRTRFLTEIGPLRQLGADEVVPEEFETSVEIFTRVLERYLVPHDEIERFTAGVRADTYQMLRSPGPRGEHNRLADLPLNLPGLEIATFRLAEQAPLAGQSLAQIELRPKFGLSLLAIQRQAQTIINPTGETILEAGDLLIVLGPPEKMDAFNATIKK